MSGFRVFGVVRLDTGSADARSMSVCPIQGDDAMSEIKWVELAGSKREPMRGAHAGAATDPQEIVDVTGRVRHAQGTKPLAGAVAALASTPAHPRQHLSREEDAKAYGADLPHLQKVIPYPSTHP